ncbi:hypothetical protein AC1031_006170 [Aphanomyces cochlioides]|nr:hypothetical protein AC1031_006170 [Aphanomyces cochlioides]
MTSLQFHKKAKPHVTPSRKVVSHGRGAIQLSLDKAHYISGDVSTGSVCVNVTEPITCNGREQVAWKEDPSTSNGKNEFRYSPTSKLVLKNTLTKLRRGEHTYSFQYQLPFGLPSTFDNHGDAGILAKIEYFIKGAVRIKGGTNQYLQNEQALLVYSKFGRSVARCKAEKERAVRLLYVIPQGKCTLRAAANKPFYYPGDVAQIQFGMSLAPPTCRRGRPDSGSVRVHVTEPMESDEVYVLFTGREEVYWEVDMSSEGHSSKVVLNNVKQTFPCGDHVFPFEYQLPLGLPGSFDNQNYQGVTAKIEYFIRGATGVYGATNLTHQKEHTMNVYAQVATTAAPSVGDKEHNVRFFCCVPLGKCSLHGSTDMNLYSQGEVAQVHVDIQNRAKIGIRSMQCRLRRTVVVVGSGETNSIVRTICSAKFAGVSAGTTTKQSNQLKLHGAGMYPSTIGSFITVSYSIDIVADIFMATDATLHLPITLGAQSITVNNSQLAVEIHPPRPQIQQFRLVRPAASLPPSLDIPWRNPREGYEL